jgi:hypothetical protein
VATWRRLLGSALAITLAITPVPVFAAAPSDASEGSGVVRASLSIDATALGGAAEGVKERIRVRGEALLRAHDVLPGRGAGDPIISITVEPLGTEPGYRCAFAVRRDDAVVGDTAGTSLCQLCTEDELVDHLEAAIERVVPQVPASTTTVSPPTAEPRGADVPPPSPRTPELRALGKGGLAAAIVGGVALGVGVGLAARDASPRSGTRIGGIAIASVSFGLLVAGLAMVIVDVRRNHADRAAATRAQAPRRRTAWVSPTAGRRSAGMVVGGRF